MTWGIFKADSVSEAYAKMKAEELKGKQHKLDVNKNGKVDGDDLAKLRNEEAVEEGVNKSDIPAYKRKDDKLSLADLEKERTQNKSHAVQLAKNNGTQKEETEVQEGWDDMLKYVKDKNGPQPNGGAGKKQGTRYGGQKQKEDESDKRKEKNEAYDESALEQISEDEWYDGSDMLGEAQARYSNSYQFTHKPGDEESEKKLADLKKSVKGTGKRVVLQGRLGKNNPNAHKYSKNAPQGTFVNGKRTNSDVSGKSGAHTHQRIQKADAAHHDVYVYDKSDTQYDPSTVIAENLSIFSAKEIDMLINEVLSKDASAGTWIKDFIKSDAPQFSGKSQEKRKEMALGAYYAAQKKESTDYESFLVLDEAKQGDIVKMGAKEIKHANMKEKQNDQEVMEPHSGTEAKFVDSHSIRVTDDPTQGKFDSGTGKVGTATAPKGKGPGSYDAKEKLGDQKTGIKEDIIKTACGEEIDTTPDQKGSNEDKAKKKFRSVRNKAAAADSTSNY